MIASWHGQPTADSGRPRAAPRARAPRAPPLTASAPHRRAPPARDPRARCSARPSRCALSNRAISPLAPFMFHLLQWKLSPTSGLIDRADGLRKVTRNKPKQTRISDFVLCQFVRGTDKGAETLRFMLDLASTVVQVLYYIRIYVQVLQ